MDGRMNEIVGYNPVIGWKNGLPEITYKEMLSKEIIADLPLVAISMPYKRSDEEVLLGIDTDLEGLTIAEVMNIRMARKAANGDKEAFKLIQDRVLGRPKQQIESTKISMSYSDYLDSITEEEIIDV